jgi:hypothetical protein
VNSYTTLSKGGGGIHTQVATRNVNLTFVGVWVIFSDVLPVAV